MRLVADGCGQMHHRLDSAQRVAEGGRIGEVTQGYLDAHAQWTQSPRIPYETANFCAFGDQSTQQRGAHQAGRARKQEHASYNMASPQGGPANRPKRKNRMAYVIAEPCIGTKDNSCVEVCPVDCIHPTPDEPGYEAAEMLYIDPEEGIDCDACLEACPVDACFAEDQLPEEWGKYTQINADYFANAK